MRNKINFTVFVVSVVFIGTFSNNILSQNKLRAKQTEEASTCEYVKNRLDYALINSEKDKDSYVFLIFRLGKEEKKAGLVDARIKLVNDYLKSKKENLSQFIVATGDPVSDLGKIEIYSDGKLFSELVFKKDKFNRDFCVE